MYRDRLKPKPEFIDYASAAAWLTSMGSSFRGVAEVINRSSAAVVGRWAWVDGAIRPIGPIDFTAVTATQGATIGSVTGQVLDLSDSTFVVTGGYTLRIWNTTDGALVSDVVAGSWTRSGAGIDAGAAVAAAVAALIAAGKSIRCWVEGLSELSIGGAEQALRPHVGGYCAFSGAGLRYGGVIAGLSVPDRQVIRARIHVVFSAPNWRAMVGRCEAANPARHILCGAGDVAGDTRRAAILNGGAIVTNVACSYGPVISPGSLHIEAIISRSTATHFGVAVGGQADGTNGTNLTWNPGFATVFTDPVFCLYGHGLDDCTIEQIEL